MAVQSDTSSITYTGNNSTVTTYAVPFVFLENSHLAATAKVTATGVESVVTLTNHTGAGDANGGTVRTAVAVPVTSTLTIYRTVPATQTTTYQEGGDFPASSHERALDKLTFLAQQNERAVTRSFRVTEGSGEKNEVVAVPNTLLGLDANNQPKALTLSEVKSYLALTGTTLSVPAGMKTFADSGERALAVPDFTGQLGTQRNTADIYIATGTAAGNWSLVDENMSLADFAAGFFTADATGRGKFGSGFVDAAMLASNSVETSKIADGAITNAKVDAAAAIAGTKIVPDFGGQQIKTTGALSIGKTDVTSPAAGDGNVYSGTYTPTVTAVTNVASAVASPFQYMRVGSVVTVSGAATLGFTAADTVSELTISLPIASTFTSTEECSGITAINTTTTSRGYGGIFCNFAGTVARARLYPNHTANRGYSIHFTYRII